MVHLSSKQIAISAVVILALSAGSSASDAAPTEEKPTIIDASNRPAAPAQSVEARMALRQHREAAALNRFTFQGNVLEGTGDIVDHWIVMFCPGWHDKCQGLLPSFELLGVHDYPSVVHYRNNQRVAAWNGGAPGLVRFVK